MMGDAKQNLDEYLMSKSKQLFAEFAQVASTVTPIGVAGGALALVTPVIILAFGMDVVDHQRIYQEHGPEAVAAFMALRPEGAVEWFSQSLAGNLHSRWQNMQAPALAAAVVLPTLAGLGAHLAQSFVKLKAKVADLTVENQKLSGTYKVPIDPRSDATDRLTGATRVDGATLSSRFNESLAALDEKLEHSQQTRVSIKGPGN